MNGTKTRHNRSASVPTLALLVLILMAPASGADTEDRSRGRGPADVGAGEMLLRSPEGWTPLPVVDLAVDLEVTGILVRGRLTQRFLNPTDRVIEALYVFPLPDRAAVRRMEMRIGERRIVSEIREKEQARRTYEQARASGRKTALVEQHRPNLFTTAAANINPGEEVAVVLEYVEEASYADGWFRLVFPMTFTPRACAGAVETDGMRTAGGETFVGQSPRAAPSDPAAPWAEISVSMQPGFPVERVDSPSHRIQPRRSGDRLLVTPRAGTVPADRDFVLTWKPELGHEPRASLLIEAREDAKYGLLMLLPPAPAEDGGLPTETLFIVDVSGSMEGPSIVQARAALLAALNRLRPDDRFNVLRFNEGQQSFSESFEPAVPERLDAAREWVRGLTAGGGTAIHPALVRGLELAGDSRGSGAQRIIFLTDGAVDNEREVFETIARDLGSVRLHTLGIGPAPNAWLMRKMASFGHGLCEFIADAGRAENRIDRFLGRLDRPVLTDLELSFDGLTVDESYPARLRDLYAGEPLLLSLRLGQESEGGRATLAGWSRGGRIESAVALDNVERVDSGVVARWARAKVESLLDGLHEGADPSDVRREVLELALDHELVTRYTSLVAVERFASSTEPAVSARIASALPRGGTDRPLRLRLGLLFVACGLVSMLGPLCLRWLATVRAGRTR